ncbi:hypothetical protein [Actinacidiphila glaucinigra]|nr:hypothetical protein [Actinacidiphila glaucinigra]
MSRWEWWAVPLRDRTVVVSGVGAGLGQHLAQAVVRVAWRATDTKDAAQ